MEMSWDKCRTIFRNCIPHPSDPNRFLYFIADVPRLLKNVKESLLNNKFFILPEEFVNKYKLLCNRVEKTF